MYDELCRGKTNSTIPFNIPNSYKFVRKAIAVELDLIKQFNVKVSYMSFAIVAEILNTNSIQHQISLESEVTNYDTAKRLHTTDFKPDIFSYVKNVMYQRVPMQHISVNGGKLSDICALYDLDLPKAPQHIILAGSNHVPLEIMFSIDATPPAVGSERLVRSILVWLSKRDRVSTPYIRLKLGKHYERNVLFTTDEEIYPYSLSDTLDDESPNEFNITLRLGMEFLYDLRTASLELVLTRSRDDDIGLVEVAVDVYTEKRYWKQINKLSARIKKLPITGNNWLLLLSPTLIAISISFYYNFFKGGSNELDSLEEIEKNIRYKIVLSRQNLASNVQ